jgi:chromate transport protein ChrA
MKMETLAQFQQHLFPVTVELFRQCVWLVLLIIFISLKRIFALSPKKTFRSAFLSDVAYYFLNNPLPKLLLLFPAGIIGWTLYFLVPGALLSRIAEIRNQGLCALRSGGAASTAARTDPFLSGCGI